MLRRLHPRTLALLLLIAASAAAVRSQTVRPNPTPTPSPARAKAAIAGNPALVHARPETAINKAASTQPAPATPTPTPSGTNAKTAVNPAILQGRPGEVVAETVVPELYWHTQRDAEVMLAQAHLQFRLSGPAEGPIVVHQEPLPGNKVVTGSPVLITLGQPQLLLSADQLRAAINTNINFTATLEPPLPQTTGAVAMAYIPPRLYAAYTFYWDDSPQISSSQAGATSQAEQTHRYAAPKTYNVYATAQIGSYQIKSNLVSITIPEPNPVKPSYAVNVRVEPRTVNVGDKVKATVETTPPPPPEASYKIDWGDGAQEVHNSPIATHAYSPPARKRAVHATVTVANRDFHSNAIAVEVRTRPEPVQPEPKPMPFNFWPWIIGVVVGIGVSVGLYKLIRRGPKLPLHLPQGLSITSSRGQIQQEIHHAEQIGKTAGIRFISGCTSSVTMTPQSGIARKRSTTHA